MNAKNLILQQQLSQENDHLLKRIEAQEKDFQVTNETLRTEIVYLQERNQKLESKVIFLENEYKTLENRLKSVQNKQNHDENEGEDEDNELSSKEPKCCLILSDPNECSPKNELSFSVLAEKEKLESQILQLNELVDSLKKENQLVTTQLEELEDKYKGIDDIQTQLDQRNKLIQQQNQNITDLKCQIEEIEQKSKQQIDYLNSQHSNKIQELESKLISEKNNSEKCQEELNALNENLTQLSNVM